MYNTKNYRERGGERWVVNGVLEVTETGVLMLNNKPLIRAANQPDSTASTIAELKDDFNSLLQKLKYAGFMEME